VVGWAVVVAGSPALGATAALMFSACRIPAMGLLATGVVGGWASAERVTVNASDVVVGDVSRFCALSTPT
jgi:hypothetical protein